MVDRKKKLFEELKVNLSRAKTETEFEEAYKNYLKLVNFENFKEDFIPKLAKKIEEKKTRKMVEQIEGMKTKLDEIRKLNAVVDELDARIEAIRNAPAVSSATREGVPTTPVGKALLAWHEGGKSYSAWEEAERFLKEYKDRAGIS